MSAILRQTPMPAMGEGRLGKILTRYYEVGLGGPENWATISSITVSGTLRMKDGEFGLRAFQKKPDLIKIIISRNQRDLVFGYDGETAWQILPEGENRPVPMPEEEARRFKHRAHFGSHLLYPFASGKQMHYVDTVPIEGAICHQIRVTLENSYQVDYFIDIHSYLEIKAQNTDLLHGRTSSVVYKDYIRELGMPIATKAERYENGEWDSSLKLHEVKVNAGLVPWMFKMPR